VGEAEREREREREREGEGEGRPLEIVRIIYRAPQVNVQQLSLIEPANGRYVGTTRLLIDADVAPAVPLKGHKVARSFLHEHTRLTRWNACLSLSLSLSLCRAERPIIIGDD